MQTKKWPKAADSPVPALIQNKQLFAFLFALLDPLLWISEFCVQFHNQRRRKPPWTEFYLKEVTFCILIRHIRYTILKL